MFWHRKSTLSAQAQSEQFYQEASAQCFGVRAEFPHHFENRSSLLITTSAETHWGEGACPSAVLTEWLGQIQGDSSIEKTDKENKKKERRDR